MYRPALFGALLCAALGAQADFRDHVNIVGSSTIYPFAKQVIEHLDREKVVNPPHLESTGSGSGIRAFCQGVGANYPDIVNASRRIKPLELEACAKAGVKGVVEMRIGYDGIVLANSRKGTKFDLSREDLFRALAAEVPDSTGDDSISNPYKSWKEVNPKLPDEPILVIGPPEGSGTREAFMDLALETGCKRQGTAWTAAMVKQRGSKGFREMCTKLRTDGAWVDGGEDDNDLVARLIQDPHALAVFGYSYLLENRDKLQGATIEDAEPTVDNIAYRFYNLARPLFFYIKREHIGQVTGLREYIQGFIAEDAWGDAGYLAQHGLVPLNDEDRVKYAEVARDLPVLESL